jgi:hypothetical protein
MTRQASSRQAPRHVAGAIVAFIGISAANVLAPSAQAALYLIALAAVVRGPHLLPRREMAVLAFAAAYLGVIAATGRGGDLGAAGAMRIVRPCVEGFLLANVLFKWCRIRDFRSAAVVLAGFTALQLAAALAMAVDPAQRAAFMGAVYADESYQVPEFIGALLFRGYGISRHHLYGLALALGLSAALLLVAASLERSGRTRIFMGVAAAAALMLVAVNARVGFVPMLVCYVVGATIAFNAYHPRHALAVAIVLVVPMASFGGLWLGEDFETVVAWLAGGLEQFSGTDSGDATTLSDLQSMLVFAPDTLDLLFGVGRPCGIDETCYSDIGFVRALQEGGVVLLAMVLYLYIRLNRHAVRLLRLGQARGAARRRAATVLAFVLHMTFLAALVKGEAFATSDYSRLVATLAVLGLLATQHWRRRHTVPHSRPERPLHPAVTS